MPDDWDKNENTMTDLAEYAEWILEKWKGVKYA
jgi:hypothetical protein